MYSLEDGCNYKGTPSCLKVAFQKGICFFIYYLYNLHFAIIIDKKLDQDYVKSRVNTWCTFYSDCHGRRQDR